MRYVVSNRGSGVSVGMIGAPEEVQSDMNLAHNLFSANSHYDLFNGRMNFNSIFKFYKFLIYKHALPVMARHRCSLRSAISIAKPEVRKHMIIKQNFMYQLKNLPVQYNIGRYDDGDFGYEYED